jgi:hypothetical protein
MHKHAAIRIVGNRPNRSASPPIGTLTASAAIGPAPTTKAIALAGTWSPTSASGSDPIGVFNATSIKNALATRTA